MRWVMAFVRGGLCALLLVGGVDAAAQDFTVFAELGEEVPVLPSGIIFESFESPPVIGPDGKVLFLAEVSGLGITFGVNESVLFLWEPDDEQTPLRVVAQEGDTVTGPGGTMMRLKTISPFQYCLDGSDFLCFTGRIGEPEQPSDEAVFTFQITANVPPRVVAMTGQSVTVPTNAGSLPGVIDMSLSQLSFFNRTVGFKGGRASFITQVDLDDDMGSPSVLFEGQSAEFLRILANTAQYLPMSDTQSYNTLYEVAMGGPLFKGDNIGAPVHLLTLTDPPPQRLSIFRYGIAEQTRLVSTLVANALGSWSLMTLNYDGDVAFDGYITDDPLEDDLSNRGIFFNDIQLTERNRPLVPPPGGMSGDTLSIALLDDSVVVFSEEVDGGPYDGSDAIWAEIGFSEFVLITFEGDDAPLTRFNKANDSKGVPLPVVFERINAVYVTPEGNISMWATLSGDDVTDANDEGIWVLDDDNEFKLVTRKGDVAIIDNEAKNITGYQVWETTAFTQADIVGTGAEGRPTPATGSDLALLMTFDDGTQTGGCFQLPTPTAPDIDMDGDVDAVDVQLVINAALGLDIDENFEPDVNGSGNVNAVDVQLVINAALGV